MYFIAFFAFIIIFSDGYPITVITSTIIPTTINESVSTTINTATKIITTTTIPKCSINNNFTCPTNSICDISYGTCSCIDPYTTFNQSEFCGYKRLNTKIIFALDISVGLLFPVGQIYACGHINNQTTTTCRIAAAQIVTDGIIGLIICWFGTIIIGTLVNFCITCNDDTDKYYDSIANFFCGVANIIWRIIVATTLIWWIVNIVRDLTGATTDSNGVSGIWY